MTELPVCTFLLVVGLVGATVSATPTSECAYTNYRLPKHIVPKHYNLEFNVDTQKYEYSGQVTVNIKVDRDDDEQVPHDIIVLNVHRDVKISDVAYIDIGSTQPSEEQFTIGYTSVVKICQDSENELLVIELGDSLANHAEGQLTISFLGKIRQDSTGIHKTKYRSQPGVDSYYVSTDFQLNKARRAFPCFDEPSFKATFDIKIRNDQSKVVLANTRLFSEVIEGDHKVSKFKTTPLMSVHLVAFAIGEFDYIEKITDGRVPTIGAYTPVGKSQQAKFALDTAITAFTYLERYFGIPLPLEKIDILSGVGLNGVKGNWGLIFCNESLVSFDDENSSPIHKGYIAQTVINGLSQQWFGDLVTLKWWNDLWLQEGVNTWIGYNLTNHLYPKLQWELNYLIESHQKGLELDTQPGIHQIGVADVGKDNIDGIVDVLVRLKSTAIIKSLHDVYVEPDEFRGGIKLYMENQQYGNAEANDLWNELHRVSELPVREFIESWTEQSGHPLIMVKVAHDVSKTVHELENDEPSSASATANEQTLSSAILSGGLKERVTRKLLLEQKRDGPASTDANENEQNYQTWMIPMTVEISDGDQQREIWKFNFDQRRALVDLPDWFDFKKNNHWMKVNHDFRGFYHVQYSRDNLLRSLKEPISSKRLGTSNRIGLLDDYAALHRNNQLTIGFPFTKLLHWYQKETEGVVLGQYIRALSLLSKHPNKMIHVKKGLFESAYGWNSLSSAQLRNPGTRNGMGVMDSHGLVAAYSILLDRNYEPLVKEALTLFDAEGNKVAPIIRELVYKAVARYGSNGQISKLLSFCSAPINCIEEKNRLDVVFAIVLERQQSLGSSSSHPQDSGRKRKRNQTE